MSPEELLEHLKWVYSRGTGKPFLSLGDLSHGELSTLISGVKLFIMKEGLKVPDWMEVYAR